MVFLEIEQPDREPVTIPLRDGVFLFPSAHMHGGEGARLRMFVRADRVRLEEVGETGHLRCGSRVLTKVELRPGQSALLDQTRLTLRSGSNSRGRRKGSSSALRTSTPSSGRSSKSRPRPVPAKRRKPPATVPETREVSGPVSQRVAGRDRWTLMSLFSAGRVGRRDLARILIIHRNNKITGTNRSIPEILQKEQFLGAGFEREMRDVEASTCLSCRKCRRVFEPEPWVLRTLRCPECDRRLECRPRSLSMSDAPEKRPTHLVTGYDRLLPGVRLGDYKIEQLLGIGGYGAVYKAFDTRIQRTVALKVFPAAREGSADVLREARNVAAFPPHPNVVLVYHVGQALGFDYISYEYVSGRSLAYHIERGTKFSMPDSLRLLRDVFSGLAVAHRHGVIHRDLKPDNILLVRVEGQFRARITDFGLGQRLRRGQGGYHSRTIRGAPEYLAPEQFRHQISSTASDLYSVGATFFHLLTGVAPFEGESDHELAERHVEDPVPLLTDYLGDCPPTLDELFEQLLAKDPKERPNSAEHALKDLDVAEQETRSSNRGFLTLSRVGTLVVVAGVIMVGLVMTKDGISAPLWDRYAQWVGPSEEVAESGGVAQAATATPVSATATRAVRPERSPEGLREQTGNEAPSDDVVEKNPEPAPSVAILPPVTEPATDQPASDDPPNPIDASEQAGADTPPSSDEPVPAEPVEDAQLEASNESSPASAETAKSVPVEDHPPAFEASADPGQESLASKEEAESEAGLDVDLSAELMESPLPGNLFVDAESLADDCATLQRWMVDGASAEQREAVVLWRPLTELLGRSVRVPSLPQEPGLCFLERLPRSSLEAEGAASMRGVEMPVYEAAQVRDWFDSNEAALQALGLTAKLRLPYPSELRSGRVEGPSSEQLRVSPLEWVENSNQAWVLFDYRTGEVRPESDDESFRRRSTVRCHVCLQEVAPLLRSLRQALQNVEALPSPVESKDS